MPPVSTLSQWFKGTHILTSLSWHSNITFETFEFYHWLSNFSKGILCLLFCPQPCSSQFPLCSPCFPHLWYSPISCERNAILPSLRVQLKLHLTNVSTWFRHFPIIHPISLGLKYKFLEISLRVRVLWSQVRTNWTLFNSGKKNCWKYVRRHIIVNGFLTWKQVRKQNISNTWHPSWCECNTITLPCFVLLCSVFNLLFNFLVKSQHPRSKVWGWECGNCSVSWPWITFSLLLYQDDKTLLANAASGSF